MSIQTLLTQLKLAMTTEVAIQKLQNYLKSQDISSFAFTYYSLNPSSRKKLNYEYASPKIKPWHNFYLESGYEDIDQTLQWGRQAILPMRWDLHAQLKQAKTKREKRLRQESLDYGIARGLNVPIHGPQQDFSVLTIYQLKDENSLDLNRTHEYFIAGYHLYAAIRKILQKSKKRAKKYNLTPRETQCLTLTTQNYLAAEIAELLSITERTVHYHLQNVNKKLGVKHKYQAVTKAIAEQLL